MARLPTVYDFSSLRLHPDGSRVQQSTSKNLKLRYQPGAVRDSRGNWFARDAAGLGTVRKYRKVREDKDDGNGKGEADEANVDEADDEPNVTKGKGKAKEVTGRRSNPRPAKRQKFMQDHDFLTPASDGSSSSEMLPSSDLLKSIHYFASSYYHERGQLFNATKEYRQMRKKNKLLKLEQQRKAETVRDDLDESDNETEIIKPTRRGGRKKGVIGKAVYPKDMYKILDGTALMAIGMLMQEYVSRTLEVRIPEGWEDMMQKTYDEAEDVKGNSEDDEVADDDAEEAEDRSRGGSDDEEAGDEKGDDEDGESNSQQDDEDDGDELSE